MLFILISLFILYCYPKLVDMFVLTLFHVLRCGLGLLMYGFGSKKTLLEDFASTSLTEYSAFVINGYLPTINIKQVLFHWHTVPEQYMIVLHVPFPRTKF